MTESSLPSGFKEGSTMEMFSSGHKSHPFSPNNNTASVYHILSFFKTPNLECFFVNQWKYITEISTGIAKEWKD